MVKILGLALGALFVTGCHNHHAQAPVAQAPVVQVKPVQVTKADYPAVPSYAAGVNSYGQLQVKCKNNTVFYTLSYACFKPGVKLSATVDGQPLEAEKSGKLGGPRYTFYQQGHFTKGNTPATIAGKVTGGNPGGTYTKVCK